MAGELIVVYDLLPEIAAKIDRAAGKVVRKAAFDIQAMAQTMAPVDTGFLKNSIYVVTHDYSNYSAAERKSSKKNADAELLPEVEPPLDSHEACIAVGADYGMYVEFGTIHQPPQPYLTPAVELEMPVFQMAVALLAQSMGFADDGSSASAEVF